MRPLSLCLGTTTVDIDRTSVIDSFISNLFATGDSSVNCDGFGSRMKVYLQFTSSPDFSWILPVYTCRRHTLADFKMLIPVELENGMFYDSSGLQLRNSDVLEDVGIRRGSSIVVDVDSSEISSAAMSLAQSNNIEFQASGGTVVFTDSSSISDVGGFSVYEDGYVSIGSSPAEFKSSFDNTGSVWIEDGGDAEFLGTVDSAGNWTNDGNMTIDDEAIFSDEFLNAGTLYITQDGNATFEDSFENTGDITIDDGGSAEFYGTTDFKSKGSVDSSGFILFGSGSQVTLRGDFVSTGATSNDDGQVEVFSDSVYFDGSFENLNEASFSVENGGYVQFASELSHTSPAEFVVQSGGEILIQGDATFEGVGVSEHNRRRLTSDDYDYVFNFGTWKISSSGTAAYVDIRMKIDGVYIVKGLLECSTSSLDLDAQIFVAADGSLTVKDDGEIEILPACTLNSDGDMISYGKIGIQKNSEAFFSGISQFHAESQLSSEGDFKIVNAARILLEGKMSLHGRNEIGGDVVVKTKSASLGISRLHSWTSKQQHFHSKPGEACAEPRRLLSCGGIKYRENWRSEDIRDFYIRNGRISFYKSWCVQRRDNL